MDKDHLHLANHETLLLNAHPAPSVMVNEVFLALVEGLVELFFLTLGVGLIFGEWNTFVEVIYGLCIISVFAFPLWRRLRSARHAVLTVTTDRILILGHEKFFFHRLHTLKWSQYQECIVERASPLGYFFGAASLTIRHGNADSKLFLHVPPVRYAADIKHYLDKVDSLVRRNQMSEIHPFIAKPKGKRD